MVEKVSKTSYQDFLTDKILAPLGLNDTGSTKPEEYKGVIPKDDFWFGTDIGFETPYVILPFACSLFISTLPIPSIHLCLATRPN